MPPTFSRLPSWIWLLPPLLVGIALRTIGLADQIQGGDELHAARAALALELPKVLVSYRTTDNCIPLTAIFRGLMDAGVVLQEMHMRVPSLIAGLIFLLLAPLALARRFGRTIGWTFAWLAALSPGLVLYSRIVRSYMPAVLLTSLAICCFYAWWRGRGARYGLAYVLAAALSAWFHLGSSPFVAAPILYAAAATLLRFERPESYRETFLGLGAVCVGLAAGVAAFALPARESLQAVMELKQSEFTVEWSDVGEVAGLQAGSDQLLPLLLFWTLAAFGFLRLWRQDRSFSAYLLSVGIVQLGTLVVVAPAGMGNPLILNRYLLFGLPILLLCVSFGLGALGASLSTRTRRNALGWIPLGALLLVLAPGGPWLKDGFWTSSFMHHNDFFRFTSTGPLAASVALPRFYDQLEGEDDRPILEFPWHPAWNTIRCYAAYQRQHGKPVRVVMFDDDLRDGAIGWRHLLHLDPPKLLASGARFFLLHRNLEREERAVAGGIVSKRNLEQLEKLKPAAEAARRRLLRTWGTPHYRGSAIWVWDLDAVRSPGANLNSTSPDAR